MLLRSIALAQVCVLLGLSVLPSRSLLGQTMQDKIDSLAQPYIASETLLGFSVGVLHKGKTFVQGYGKVDSNVPNKPDGDTVYEIGSISKVFTSLLLGDAVVQGNVRLDQPIVELCPKDQQPHESLAKINLAHLATHTSGLPRLPSNIDLTIIDDPYSKYTPELMLQFLHEHKLAGQPGSKHEYSNLGAGLLGWLIVNQSQMSYEAILKQRMLEPLGLHDTTITLSGAQKQRFAPGHDLDGNRCSPWEFSALVGAGGIRSTVNDMLKFAAVNLKPPTGEIGEAIELAWKIHQPKIGKTGNAMGLGWLIDGDGESRFHNGQTGGYHSMMYVNRKNDLAVVVLSNTASGEVDRLAHDIFKLAAGGNVEPRKFDTRVDVSSEVMQKYVGEYQLIPNVKFTVTVQDGKLMVGLTGQPTFRVYPKSDTEWAYKVVKATITFRQDKNGDWNELVLFQNGARQKAVRVQEKTK